MILSDRDWTDLGGFESIKRMAAQHRNSSHAKLAIAILAAIVTILLLSTIG